MQIIQCTGGLGNQMFQYAFYRKLQLDGNTVALDLSSFQDYKLHNGFELERVFNLNIVRADEKVVDEIKKTAFLPCILSKIYRKLKLSNSYIVQKEFNYQPKYSQLSNSKSSYLEGYWQSEKYFERYANIIQTDFKFPELDKVNKLLASQIQQSNAVSLHVRMGDYVNHPLHGGICTREYYSKAIELIKSRVDNPTFFVFSNEIEWCQQNFELSNVVYVTGNDGESSYKDMQLMSLCQHNIIANSSFSWWGAWLNSNPSKIVIAPAKWFNDKSINVSDLLPNSWIKL